MNKGEDAAKGKLTASEKEEEPNLKPDVRTQSTIIWGQPA